jgi:serine/threonine-protein kinase
LTGKIVGDRYRVAESLGTGATGTTYAAEHVTFARPCALKVVRPRHATAELATRVFQGDAMTAFSIAHPSLVEVFDVGALQDGTPFYVMERLDGETLQTHVQRQKLSLAAGIDMMMQLLSAIVALHARELLVRDLRPNNVFLVHRRGCRPLVKVLDSGLGRMSPLDRLQEQWNQNGPQPGAHPHYLSPERIRGEHAVEVASDIFVAGVVFYESLAGEKPFTGTSWRVIVDQVSRGEPTPLHERRADIPVELSQFVSRSLSTNPRSRPQTAKEMQDELRSIFEDARKQSVSIYAPPNRDSSPASKRPSGSQRIAAEAFADETEVRKPRPAPMSPLPAKPVAPPTMNPHPAMMDELEQTLERIDNPNAKLLKAIEEDDETKTETMNPELRARIDQLIQPPSQPRRR